MPSGMLVLIDNQQRDTDEGQQEFYSDDNNITHSAKFFWFLILLQR